MVKHAWYTHCIQYALKYSISFRMDSTTWIFFVAEKNPYYLTEADDVIRCSALN